MTFFSIKAEAFDNEGQNHLKHQFVNDDYSSPWII